MNFFSKSFFKEPSKSNETKPDSVETSNEGYNLHIELSPENKEALAILAAEFFTTVDTITEAFANNWKTISSTTALTTLLSFAEAKTPDATQSQQSPNTIVAQQLEVGKNVSPEQVLGYEDQLADLAQKSGPAYKVTEGNKVVWERKFKSGDNMLAKFFYKDSGDINPEGFALDFQRLVDNKVQEAIISDGTTFVHGKTSTSDGNSIKNETVAVKGARDGFIDETVYKVDGIVRSEYRYYKEEDPVTKKLVTKVDLRVLCKDGVMRQANVSDAELCVVRAEEYMAFAAKTAAETQKDVKPSVAKTTAAPAATASL